MLGWDTAAWCEAGCGSLCGRVRRQQRRRRGGGGRAGQMGQKEQRAPSGSGPSAGPRGGKAETQSGTVLAWRSSVNSPDSCTNDRGRERCVLPRLSTQRAHPPDHVSAVSLPLVPSVLISTESSSQVEGAVRSQSGVHPLGEMKNLGRRERFPLPLLSLQPTLAATCWALLSAPERENFVKSAGLLKGRAAGEVISKLAQIMQIQLNAYILQSDFSSLSLLQQPLTVAPGKCCGSPLA